MFTLLHDCYTSLNNIKNKKGEVKVECHRISGQWLRLHCWILWIIVIVILLLANINMSNY